MMVCQICQKGVRKISYSRHKKGSSGASEWPLRAPIHKRMQKPNLHMYFGMKLCTKCLRAVKKNVYPQKRVEAPVQTPIAS